MERGVSLIRCWNGVRSYFSILVKSHFGFEFKIMHSRACGREAMGTGRERGFSVSGVTGGVFLAVGFQTATSVSSPGVALRSFSDAS